jgi:uncharacterized membrane protein
MLYYVNTNSVALIMLHMTSEFSIITTVFTFPEIIILLISEFFNVYFFVLKYVEWCHILLSGSSVRCLVDAECRKLKTWSWGVLQWRVFMLEYVKIGKDKHTRARAHARTYTRACTQEVC